jgi:hypothetical protein
MAVSRWWYGMKRRGRGWWTRWTWATQGVRGRCRKRVRGRGRRGRKRRTSGAGAGREKERKIHPVRVSTSTAAGKDTSSAGGWGRAGRYGGPQERRSKERSDALARADGGSVARERRKGRSAREGRGRGGGHGTCTRKDCRAVMLERGARIRPNARDGTGDHDTHKGREKGRGRDTRSGWRRGSRRGSCSRCRYRERPRGRWEVSLRACGRGFRWSKITDGRLARKGGGYGVGPVPMFGIVDPE